MSFINSLIIPVYKNADNVPSLIAALQKLQNEIELLEIVFVVDGSPDASARLLEEAIPGSKLKARLLVLSRNFGSYQAIRAGMIAARGQFFAVMAADLQEPPELVVNFFQVLQSERIDLVIAVRESRADPFFSKLASNVFWSLYKRFVMPEMPKGGVDIFACNLAFRDHLIRLEESHSSLVALLFWMGFRRKEISYVRQARQVGKSAWTFKKKYNYLKDSVFSFTDIPIKLLKWIGVLGLAFSMLMAAVVLIGKLTGWVTVQGFSATVLTIIFFGALNLLGLGIIGTYAWRTYENTKRRPTSIVMFQSDFN
ncbi:MAG: glycosyltransferase [Proteobacteria bacterium]|nr:MAG: glycosyltransferase [Pseudomonadota bacterium]